MDKKNIQSKLEWLTSRWWFFALFLLLQLLPPIASKGFGQAGVSKFLAFHITNNLMRAPEIAYLYPFFKVLPILLIVGIILLGNKVSRLFSIYAAIAYLMFNVLQNISITQQYGAGILTQNVISMLLVSMFWTWEAYAGKNDLSPAKTTPLRIIVIALAILAFWDPINPVTHGVDFNPVLLVNNAGGLAFCMMTPGFLATLIYYYPKVDLALLRVNSFAGLIIGIFNVLVVFADPAAYWWFGMLHIPLFALSAYGLFLGLRGQAKRRG